MKQFKLVIEKHRGPAEHHGSDNLLELWEKAWWAFMNDEYPLTIKRVDFWVGEKKLRGSCTDRDRFFRGVDSMAERRLEGKEFEGAYVPGWIWSQHEKGQVSLKQIKDWALSGCRSVAQTLKEEGKDEGFAKQLRKIEGAEKILGRRSHYYRR